MYSIGDLSQLGGVTPRMPRHHHELGILVPADVGDATGYRRYDESQLTDLLQVLALKGLGFALTDIKSVVDGGISPSELRGSCCAAPNSSPNSTRPQRASDASKHSTDWRAR
jgi:DNA-binding transcriptional MerR regulator